MKLFAAPLQLRYPSDKDENIRELLLNHIGTHAMITESGCLNSHVFSFMKK